MRRFALPLILILALAAMPGVALAVTKTDHVTGTVKKTGTEGTKLVYEGHLTSTAFGKGYVIQKIGAVGLVGTFSIKYKRGTVRGTVRAHAKGSPDGTVNVTGTYKFTGGTGAYKKIKGTGTFRSKADVKLTQTTFNQTGKVTY